MWIVCDSQEMLSLTFCEKYIKLEAQVGQKSLTWIRLIMMVHCAMLAILAIRSDCLEQFRIWCCLKSFKIATMAAILDIGTKRFSNSESPWYPDASHQILAQPILLFLRRCGLKNFKMAGGGVVWRFSRWLTWRPSWISERNDFSNSKSPCGLNASHQSWAQSDLGFRSRRRFKIFKMAKRNDLSYS